MEAHSMLFRYCECFSNMNESLNINPFIQDMSSCHFSLIVFCNSIVYRNVFFPSLPPPPSSYLFFYTK